MESQSNETSAAPVPENKPEPIHCPSCDAVLLKVEPTPGVKIRCPNCGHRFALLGDADSAQAATEAAPLAREPKSPGYWLLRIPAIIALTAGIVIPLFVGYQLYHELFSATAKQVAWRRPNTLEFWIPYSYVPLTTVAGLLSFYLTRALARIDANIMHAAWRSGNLTEPLPPAPGSSLPTIAPPAVLGGVLPIFSSILLPGENIVPSCICGALLLYLGFAFEDLRQFAWRQKSLAQRMNPDSHLPPQRSWIALSFVIAGAGWCLFFLVLAGRNYTRDSSVILIGLACLAVAISLSAIGRVWDGAVSGWIRTPAQPLTGVVRYTAAFPLLWAGYGFIWMFLTFVFAETHLADNEGFLWLFIAVGCVAFAFALNRVLRQVGRWRQALNSCLTTLGAAQQSIPKLSLWQRIVVWWPWLLSLVELCVMGTLLFEEAAGLKWRRQIEWRFVFALPVILGMVHYPAVWLATMVREFLLLQRTLDAAKPTEDT